MKLVKISDVLNGYPDAHIYKVFGADGHRQRLSFGKSSGSLKENWLCVKMNSDCTGTNDFSILILNDDANRSPEHALSAQLYDGVFENCKTGETEEMSAQDFVSEYGDNLFILHKDAYDMSLDFFPLKNPIDISSFLDVDETFSKNYNITELNRKRFSKSDAVYYVLNAGRTYEKQLIEIGLSDEAYQIEYFRKILIRIITTGNGNKFFSEIENEYKNDNTFKARLIEEFFIPNFYHKK